MVDYLLVDGYNIINAWESTKEIAKESLENARDRLANTLQNYAAFKNLAVILVFDAHLVKGAHRNKEQRNHLQIVFTEEGETADSMIEALAYQLCEINRVYVATSDWDEQRVVMGTGALRISAKEFEKEVLKSEKASRRYFRQEHVDRNPLDARLTEEQITRLENMFK